MRCVAATLEGDSTAEIKLNGSRRQLCSCVLEFNRPRYNRRGPFSTPDLNGPRGFDTDWWAREHQLDLYKSAVTGNVPHNGRWRLKRSFADEKGAPVKAPEQLRENEEACIIFLAILDAVRRSHFFGLNSEWAPGGDGNYGENNVLLCLWISVIQSHFTLAII